MRGSRGPGLDCLPLSRRARWRAGGREQRQVSARALYEGERGRAPSPPGAYAALGPLGYWQWRLAALEQAATQGYVAPSEFAGVYTALGDNDAAFEQLERAYEERDAMDRLNVWPGYDPLRSDPRFDDLLRRMNFPE